MSIDDCRPAGTFEIGDKIKFVRGLTGARNPIWVHATVYRKTKNFVYIQTKSKKIKCENDWAFFERHS